MVVDRELCPGRIEKTRRLLMIRCEESIESSFQRAGAATVSCFPMKALAFKVASNVLEYLENTNVNKQSMIEFLSLQLSQYEKPIYSLVNDD